LCIHYESCTYPERVVSKEYERLLGVKKLAEEALEKARKDVKMFNVYKGG
jgi:hypothetical protein